MRSVIIKTVQYCVPCMRVAGLDVKSSLERRNKLFDICAGNPNTEVSMLLGGAVEQGANALEH